MAKEVVLTGLRANGEYHLGNYLGAILPMIHLNNKHSGKYQVNMFIPDLHSFTTPIDHHKLYSQTIKNIKIFVAAGLKINDPDVFIYRQSFIPAHSELTWILDCFTGFGEASRMIEFKEKIKQNGDDRVSLGLLNYPVLMAADILLYGAKWIPVGEDQRQHVEFARKIAIRFNNKFGDIFVIPEDNAKQTQFIGNLKPVRIRSLRVPEKKMSKSIEDPAGTILLSDDPDKAAEKVMAATTDSIGKISHDFENQVGIANLMQILALLSGHPQEEIDKAWVGKSSYGELKKQVATSVKQFLSQFQDRLAKVNEEDLMGKLVMDEKAMNDVANSTLAKVQSAVGLRP